MAKKETDYEQRLIVAGLLLQALDPDPAHFNGLVAQITRLQAKYPHPRKDVLLLRLQQAVVRHRKEPSNENLALVTEAAKAALEGAN